MDLGKLITKAKEVLKKIPEVFSALLSSIVPKKKEAGAEVPKKKSAGGFRGFGAFFTKNPIQNFLLFLEDNFLHRFPENKRRPILYGLAGMALLFIGLLLSIPLTLSGNQGQTLPSGITAGFTIPSDELFFPPEPDFLPEFIFEREPRGQWRLEDIQAFWRNPEYSDLWRDQIKSAVDSLMESVP